MTVQSRAQPLLIQEMSNKPDATTENKQAVQHTHVEIVFGFLAREGATVAQEVDKTDGDAAVNIEDQIVFLGRGDSLYGNGVVEQAVGGKVLLNEFFDQLNPKIWV